MSQVQQCPSCYTTLQKRGERNNKKRYWCPNCGARGGGWYSAPAELVSRTAKVLVMDIETLPLVFYGWDLWHPVGSYKNIIKDSCILSWAAKWLFDSEIHGQVLTPKEAVARDDARIMKKAWELMDEADAIIFHNGIKFDNPSINTRFLYHRMDPPSPYQIIDTYASSRKVFKFPSHSQGYITQFLELQEKLKTDFELWKACDNGDKKALADMFAYNKVDILGLEEMYVTLRPWLPQHPNLSVYLTTTEAHCPKCTSKNISFGGVYSTPANLYRCFRCKNCGTIGRTSSSVLTTAKRKGMVRVS